MPKLFCLCTSIEIPGRYVADIRLTHTWKNWLVYLETTNFLDKHYEKYRGPPGQNGFSVYAPKDSRLRQFNDDDMVCLRLRYSF